MCQLEQLGWVDKQGGMELSDTVIVDTLHATYLQ